MLQSEVMTTPRSGTTTRRTPGKPKIDAPDDFQAAWTKERPRPDAWTPRPWVPIDERAALGRAARQRAPRSSQGALELAPGRDPVAIILAQETDRLQDLLPLRHGRMATSAFAFYRGAPAVMALDLSTTPRSNIIVQASGDAHCSNFGLFASPERSLVFDANDFDETLPGPWEWDVKRLAASIVIAARANGFSAAATRTVTMASVRGYRENMARYSGMRLLDIWYDQTTADDIERGLIELGKTTDPKFDPKDAKTRLNSVFSKARGKDQMKASTSLTAVVDGHWRIVDDPPVVQHVELPGGAANLEKTFSDYRATLAENRRELVERYRFVDVALKVVGVGSVGTRCFVVLLEGRDEGDPLFLQAKEATASVLDPYLGVEPPQQPRRARRGRPAADAGDARHLPRLDARPRRPGLLLPPAVGHEGLGRHRDAPRAGHGLLRRPVRPVAGAGPRPERRLDRDRGLSRHERHVRRGGRRLRRGVCRPE